MNPINANKPIRFVLILFDNLMDSERDISFLSQYEMRLDGKFSLFKFTYGSFS